MLLQVADMETNPYLKTEIGRIVRSRSELYQNLQLELNLMEERLGEVELKMRQKHSFSSKTTSQTLYKIRP